MEKYLTKEKIVYQIYPRSFCDSDRDGIGDIKGIISKLDHLADLGVNTVWLSPIYKSPDDDNGYDISDYKSIQPAFGTMEDFETLVAEARKRGIGIVMDLVINHTSDEHEWFKRALAGEEKYKNYYIIKKGKGKKLPNNWGNFFAECPWAKFGDSEDEYYLHLFSKKQPDLNWHNPEVLEEVVGIMDFWLEKGVCGFRCDVINIIYKDSLEDGKPSFILTGKEHYLSRPGCHEILKKLRERCLSPNGAFAVGETVFVGLDEARRLCDGELDMVFYFEHMECDQVIVKWFKKKLKPKKLMRILTKWQSGLDWNAVYFENHDQPRFISRLTGAEKYREQASKMTAGLLCALRGTPFIYEGQEIGMTNGDFLSLDEVEDIESHNVYAMAKRLGIPKGMRWKMIKRTSRDNARTPMQWSDESGAGFTSGKPWLKINGNYKEINVDAERAREDGVLAFWKKMIEMRKTDEALLDGSFKSVYEGKRVFAFERASGKRRVTALMNMTDKKAKLPIDKKDLGALMISNYKERREDVLMPFEFRLYESEDIL